MLDFAHRLVLQGVAKGEDDDSPAMRSLLAAGLVARGDDGGHVLTPAGVAALEASKPSRWERILWPVLGVCATIVLVSSIIDWVT